jgi:hypothetical protein
VPDKERKKNPLCGKSSACYVFDSMLAPQKWKERRERRMDAIFNAGPIHIKDNKGIVKDGPSIRLHHNLHLFLSCSTALGGQLQERERD